MGNKGTLAIAYRNLPTQQHTSTENNYRLEGGRFTGCQLEIDWYSEASR